MRHFPMKWAETGRPGSGNGLDPAKILYGAADMVYNAVIN